VAPLHIRINNNIVLDGQPENEAKKDIQKIHFNRKDYIRKYFSKNISNANYYNLVINTKNTNIAEAADIVVAMYQDRFRL